MDFKDINIDVQNKIVDILNNHIAAVVGILKEDKFLEPMMRINANDSKDTLISLVSEDGSIDVDRALETSINRLKVTEFNYALFSYSTQIGLSSTKVMDALKTYIFLKDGLTVAFYTPYEFKGLFKKNINIERTLLDEVNENIFE